jgi:hypothetical protein
MLRGQQTDWTLGVGTTVFELSTIRLLTPSTGVGYLAAIGTFGVGAMTSGGLIV